MKLNRLVALFVSFFGVTGSALSSEQDLSDIETNVVLGLAEAMSLYEIELACYQWEAGTISYVQDVFIAGMLSIAKNRLDNGRYDIYISEASKESDKIADKTVQLISHWRESNQLGAVETYCAEDVPYTRIWSANLMLSSIKELSSE